MAAAILGEVLRQVFLRHEHAGRIEVADIERDQLAAVVVFGDVRCNMRAPAAGRMNP